MRFRFSIAWLLLAACHSVNAETNLAWVCPSDATSVTACDSRGAWRAPTDTSRVFTRTASGGKATAVFGPLSGSVLVAACAADVPVGTSNRCGPVAGNWDQEYWRQRDAWSAPVCTTPRPTEAQTVSCAAPAAGSWAQTRTVAAAPYPTCWTVGSWTPAGPPAGACTFPAPGHVVDVQINSHYDACEINAGLPIAGGVLEVQRGTDAPVRATTPAGQVTCAAVGIPQGTVGYVRFRTVGPDGQVSPWTAYWPVLRGTPQKPLETTHGWRISYSILKEWDAEFVVPLPPIP